MGYALESAAVTGTEVVVLDRPNPLTGMHVEGPVSDGKHLSFVNYTTEPIRHGMTMGELAKMFNSERHAPRLVRFHRSGLDQPVAEYAEYE